MKKSIIFIFLKLLSATTFAQGNLVFNPSFELMDTCPYSVGQSNFATGWSSYKQSPDYYNSCSGTSSIVSVPYNAAGFQNAHFGEAYFGLQTFFTPGTREIIGSALLSPMVIGQQYFVSIYISCAFDTAATGIPAACASSKIGVKFSTTSYSVTNPVAINNFAHVFADSILKDTVGWYQLNGSFFADSTYNFIMIGNFFDDVNTDTFQFIPNFHKAYYLIDDICVSAQPECVLTSQVNEKQVSNQLLYDQLSKKLLVDLGRGSRKQLLIYNLYGKLIFSEFCLENSGRIEISSADFNEGIYIAYLATEKKTFILKFLVN